MTISRLSKARPTMTPAEEQEWERRVKSGEMLKGHERTQWVTASVSPGAIVGEHKDCGGEIVVTDVSVPDPSLLTFAMCEKCGKRYRLTLRAELEAV